MAFSGKLYEHRGISIDSACRFRLVIPRKAGFLVQKEVISMMQEIELPEVGRDEIKLTTYWIRDDGHKPVTVIDSSGWSRDEEPEDAQPDDVQIAWKR